MIILNIEGMHCEGCEKRIKNSLESIDGVKSVKASHKEGTVTIDLNKDVNIEIIKERLIDLGFSIKD